MARIADVAQKHKNLHLPIPLLHKAVEIEADELGDLTLGFRAGSRFADIVFNEILSNQHKERSLPSAIIDLSIWLSENSAGTQIHLAWENASATLFQKRVNSRAAATAQADAFTVAVMIQTIKLHVHHQFEREKIAIAISEPGLLPTTALPLGSLKKLAHSGFILEFPVEWLLSAQHEYGTSLSQPLLGEDNFLSAFDSVLRDIIGIPLPKLAVTAGLLNLTPRELQTELEQRGTTYTEVATTINCEFAMDQLRGGEMTATKIGELIGYSDHSSFSRAFKRWTDMSPEQFRAAHTLTDNTSSLSDI